jgi:predicted metal-dependent hydrolase
VAPIAYRLERSARRRTVGISVDPERGVLVRAPARLGLAHIEQVVRDKAAWIAKQQAAFIAQGLPLPPRTYLDGELLPWLGRDHALRLEPMPRPGPVRLDGDHLVVPLDPALAPGLRPQVVRTALLRWYRLQAARLLPQRVERFAQALGVGHPKVIIADQKTRWGSCNKKGELRLNWRIVMAPLALVDYLAAHETCHILVPNHSPEFWRRLAGLLPDCAARRAELGRLGPRLRL